MNLKVVILSINWCGDINFDVVTFIISDQARLWSYTALSVCDYTVYANKILTAEY